MKVYEAIPELIQRSGLDTAFGLFGSANVAWVGHAVQKGSLRFFHTRHEGTAVTAAAAYSRVSGRIGIATTTLGPGFANTVNALAAALHDHVPVILFVGQSPSSKMHGDFQTLKQKEIVQALGAGFHSAARPEELEEAYWSAWRDVQWNGTAQVVSIDEAILESDVDLTQEQPPELESREAPERSAVIAAVGALAAAEAPLILAGQGALLADCHDDLVELADLVGARVASTLNVHRFFAGHPRDMGVCGKSSSPLVAEQLADTDVVLAVGASLNSFTTSDGGIFPRAKVIQCEIDVDADFKASSAELGLLGDARLTVRALIEEWKARGWSKRAASRTAPSWRQMQESVLRTDLGHDPSRGLDLREAYVAFDEILPEDRIVITDGGRAGIPIPALVNGRDGRSWLPSRGYGSIGLGIAASIGAAVAAPDRRVVLFCGDGGFMMSAQEIDTIRLYGLNVIIVVMNDQQYGSEVKYLNRFGLDLAVAQYTTPDLELLARAFGGEAKVLRTAEDLAGLSGDVDGLFVYDVRIDPEVDPANI